MRIVFLTWRDCTHPDGGGSEVFVEEVARHLVSRGHEVTVLCARHEGSSAISELGGVRFIRLGGRLTVYPRGLLWVAKRGRDFDVVVDVINGLPFGTPLIRRRGVVALVHHVHQKQWQIIYPGFWGRLGWFIERRVTPRLYHRVAHLTVSNASREDLVAMGIARNAIRVVRNGVGSSPAGAIRSTSPRVAVLARLVPHKQVEHAFAVIEQLRAELPGLHLDVIGEGWWRVELEADLRTRGLSDAVTLHGHVDEATRDRLLGEAWLMLLPSLKEGWGLAVLEAAVQGTPTIAYREAGGVVESVIDDVTGLLASDVAELLTLTRALLTDEGRRNELGRHAATRAAEFEWSATTDAVESVLKRAQRVPVLRTGRRR